MLLSSTRKDWLGNVRGDVLAGIVVALALIPEAIAFSIIAGVDPQVGLYSAFCIPLVMAFLGGRPAMISSATGAMALLVALISILIYVGFRFEWRLAAGVVIALAHDVIITLGILSLFHIEIDLTIVASLMSVIGYSLNDSIVVSDRIRENFRKIRRGTPYEIFNVSLTQTLHRTLITSGTTLMVILMLYLFGGPVLEGFSLTMLIGVSIGTASSIYVASALALKLSMKREHMLQQKVEKEGADQPSILP